MANNERAKTAEELKAKYGNKRLSSPTAGKSIIYSYLYTGYQVEERTPRELLKPLYRDRDAFKRKVETPEDAYIYNAYVHLQTWTANAFETAIFMRNGLKSVIAHFYEVAATLMAGEELRSALGDKAEEETVSLWLRTLTIDNYGAQSDNFYGVQALRTNIAMGLRYLNAYNTFIELIAAAIEIPEFTFFKVDMTDIDSGLKSLNEALKLLKETIEEHRGDGLSDYLRDALKSAFEPVEEEAPPIPEQNITLTRRQLTARTLNGTMTWTATFTDLYTGYWRPYKA